jgi:coenzyme PQQ precursor peptide PqqA
MIRRLCRAGAPRDHASRDRKISAAPSGVRVISKETSMKWETPTATDIRLGFEITMYVAAR